MEGEKGLKILIADDCNFDAALGLEAEKKKEKYIEDAFIYEIALYKSFPYRLTEALRQKGYQVSKVTIVPEWKKENNILLSEYDVIISDFQFPTDHTLPLEKILQQPGMKEKLEKTAESILRSLKEFEEKGYNINEGLEKYLENMEALEKELALRWDDTFEGFLPLGLEAKKLGKKITYYTSEMWHGLAGLIIGAVYDLFTPEDVAEIMVKSNRKELVSSDKGNLLEGYKSAGGSDVKNRRKIFNRWVKAVEIAIKYQTE